MNRNFNVTQFYSVAAAATGEVIGGTQDNGTNYIDFLGNTTMAAKEIQEVMVASAKLEKLTRTLFCGASCRNRNKVVQQGRRI